MDPCTPDFSAKSKRVTLFGERHMHFHTSLIRFHAFERLAANHRLTIPFAFRMGYTPSKKRC